MDDMDKVAKGLKLCVVTGDFCGECPYDGMEESCIDHLHDDALALLQEQEEQIKTRDESLEKAREEIKWLRGMLKEQEEEIDKAFQSGVDAGAEAQWASEHI